MMDSAAPTLSVTTVRSYGPGIGRSATARNSNANLEVNRLSLTSRRTAVLDSPLCHRSAVDAPLSGQLSMKLIFLHGAPATGKLTVARALLRIVPGRLFDNHAAIDVARTVFDFGAPGFWALVQTVRSSVLDAAALHGVPLVVATYCYAEPDDRPAFEQFEAILQRHRGELHAVFLHCSKAEMIRRVSNADRAEHRKITSEIGLNDFLAQFNMSPVPRADCLALDTETSTADATAQEIIRHFHLTSVRRC